MGVSDKAQLRLGIVSMHMPQVYGIQTSHKPTGHIIHKGPHIYIYIYMYDHIYIYMFIFVFTSFAEVEACLQM